jgi:single-strand DNA-binding protein
MSLNLNHIVLAGNLTRDPELRQINTERVVANVGMAINRRWKNAAGELQEEATFVDLEAWGRTAEIMGQYLKKGSPVYVEGRLKLDQWEDKDGQKRSRLKVVAENVQFLGGKPTGGQGSGDGEPAPEASAAAPMRSTAPSRGRPAPSRTPVMDGEPPF